MDFTRNKLHGNSLPTINIAKPALSPCENDLRPISTDMPIVGPNLTLIESIKKPTRWLHLERPPVPKEKNLTLEPLGKCSNTLSPEESLIQKRRIHGADVDGKQTFPTVVVDA